MRIDEFTAVLVLVGILILSVIGAVSLPNLLTRVPRTQTPCSDHTDTLIKNLPARCLKELNIIK